MSLNRRIFCTGDFHGAMDIHKVGASNWDEGKNLTKDDILFQLGDFGLIWNHTPRDDEKYWTEWLDEKPWTTIVIPGNHENWQKINSLPTVIKFGGKCRQYTDSIFIVERGEVLDIDGKTFFCFGGATSIDKLHRKEGISWWAEEVHSYADEMNAWENLEEFNYNIDYILSHSCAHKVVQNFFPGIEDCPTARFLTVVESEIKFKKNYFGHFHMDCDVDEKHTCLYNDIKEIDNED